jgi:hypothetical protein
MKLEISERRGDWSVPEIPVLDGRSVLASHDLTQHVDAAVQRLSRQENPFEDEEPDLIDSDPDLIEPEEDEAGYDDFEEPEDVDGVPDIPEPDIQIPLRAKPQTMMPAQRNIPDQGDVMIGGGSSEHRPKPPPERDPWAPPPRPSVSVVKSGAKIQFGTDGKAKVIHE